MKLEVGDTIAVVVEDDYDEECPFYCYYKKVVKIEGNKVYFYYRDNDDLRFVTEDHFDCNTTVNRKHLPEVFLDHCHYAEEARAY